MKVLICIAQSCKEKATDYDKVVEIDSFLTEEAKKNPIKFYFKLSTLLKEATESEDDVSFEELKKILYETINNDLLDLIFNSDKDIKIDICKPRDTDIGILKMLMLRKNDDETNNFRVINC